MPYVADLHIHSRFSRACSQALTIPNLSKWAKYKGIDLIGTGDCLHPLWQKELKTNLKERLDGILEFNEVKFLLTTEVSCIYSEGGKVRRIHLLIFLPTFSSAEKLTQELTKRGVNLISDGRPIMGMSSKTLCQIVFSIEPKAIIIPAHIWTPWFSLYGSNSGYDFLNECFGKYSKEIYAIETGLSSEPAMNWRVADLDNKSICSFSDAHSLPRLARECTIFKGSISFDELRNDLKTQNILGTIEFFPEEGKYHYSGHRNCNIIYSPEQLKAKGKICPVCKKPLTVGVMQRVEDLATRSEEELKLKKEEGVIKSETFPSRPGFRMLVQLEEIIAEVFNTTVSSQKTQNEYEKLVTNLDSELKILTKTPIADIKTITDPKIAEGIQRVKEGKLSIEPGYDNTYGKVKIWNEEDIGNDNTDQTQISLF